MTSQSYADMMDENFAPRSYPMYAPKRSSLVSKHPYLLIGVSVVLALIFTYIIFHQYTHEEYMNSQYQFLINFAKGKWGKFLAIILWAIVLYLGFEHSKFHM